MGGRDGGSGMEAGLGGRGGAGGGPGLGIGRALDGAGRNAGTGTRRVLTERVEGSGVSGAEEWWTCRP